MWEFTRKLLDHHTEQYAFNQGGKAVPYRDVLHSWQNDQAFRAFFISTLKDTKFSAYRFETPPITDRTVDHPFEFVLLFAPELDQTPDAQPFAEHFEKAEHGQQVVTFPSLGKDAMLIAPCPVGPESCYGHLASFIRQAPSPQVHELWQCVGKAVSLKTGRSPLWLSTAGMGVSWLHVRIDSRPKYYGHAAYRQT